MIHKAISKSKFLDAAWNYPLLQKMAGVSVCDVAVRDSKLITEDNQEVTCKTCLTKMNR